MVQANQLKSIAPRMFCVLAICLWFPLAGWANADKDRKAAAKTLATEIERGQFHKVYVTDFLDSAGTRTEKGCFFASAFSTLLSKDAHRFSVVNRIQAQKQLNELHISPQDFLQPEMLSKAAQALGADAVLAGLATFAPKETTVFLSLRDAASGKEVHSMDYREKLDFAFETNFPAAEDAASHVYYFPGLDDVTQPKCIYCPDPPYTDDERKQKMQGTVLMSVAIDEKGKVIGARVIKAPYQEFARSSINVLRDWRMEPSHDINGNPVPIRAMVEIAFHLLN